MGAVASIRQSADYSATQLALIKRTIAADCNDEEFNLFIEAARRMGLDPFRRQIMPLVFSKNDAGKRRMSLVTGIDGFRVIAARCADYRPDEREPEFEYATNLISPANPVGIVKASVTVWKQDRQGAWHPINGVAYWDEFVALKNEGEDGFEWVDTGEVWEDSGKPKKRKKPKGNIVPTADGNWQRMPRIMIAKCAEAQALRKGWPEEFSGLYDSAEMERAVSLDRSAAELVAEEEAERRQRAVGGRGDLFVDWRDGGGLTRVPIGQFADRVIAFLERATPEQVTELRDVNRETFREFWAKAPNDALEIKKLVEAAVAKVPA